MASHGVSLWNVHYRVMGVVECRAPPCLGPNTFPNTGISAEVLLLALCADGSKGWRVLGDMQVDGAVTSIHPSSLFLAPPLPPELHTPLSAKTASTTALTLGACRGPKP